MVIFRECNWQFFKADLFKGWFMGKNVTLLGKAKKNRNVTKTNVWGSTKSGHAGLNHLEGVNVV